MAFRREPENVKLARIKKILDDHKLSYAELGRQIGFSRDYISRILRKKRPLTEEFCLRFSEFITRQSHQRKTHKTINKK